MIKTLILKIKRKIEKKRFKNYGSKSFIHYTTIIKNPQYIYVGENVFVGKCGVIEAWDEYNAMKFKPSIVIGDGTMINSHCHIGAINGITIGKDCLLGSNVMIIDHSHGSSSVEECHIHPAERDLYSKGRILIEDRVWIGENAVILPGVTVGRESIVGAGSIVTKSVPARCVVVGNPAKVVKYLKKV